MAKARCKAQRQCTANAALATRWPGPGQLLADVPTACKRRNSSVRWENGLHMGSSGVVAQRGIGFAPRRLSDFAGLKIHCINVTGEQRLRAVDFLSA